MDALKLNYAISHEWEGTQYLSLTIDWDYGGGEVHISMPDYISEAL